MYKRQAQAVSARPAVYAPGGLALAVFTVRQNEGRRVKHAAAVQQIGRGSRIQSRSGKKVMIRAVSYTHLLRDLRPLNSCFRLEGVESASECRELLEEFDQDGELTGLIISDVYKRQGIYGAMTEKKAVLSIIFLPSYTIYSI